MAHPRSGSGRPAPGSVESRGPPGRHPLSPYGRRGSRVPSRGPCDRSPPDGAGAADTLLRPRASRTSLLPEGHGTPADHEPPADRSPPGREAPSFTVPPASVAPGEEARARGRRHVHGPLHERKTPGRRSGQEDRGLPSGRSNTFTWSPAASMGSAVGRADRRRPRVDEIASASNRASAGPGRW